MINRIVKMTFREDFLETFRFLFSENKNKIRAFEGCLHLELWQDVSDKRVFTTFSKWNSEESLNIYRNSELFKTVWKETITGFSSPPQAISFKTVEN